MKETINIFGFVFKVDDRIYVSEYLGENRFSDGYNIDNNKPYENLKEDEISLAVIEKIKIKEDLVKYVIQDIKKYPLEKYIKENGFFDINNILSSQNFKEEIALWFESLYKHIKNELDKESKDD